MNNPILAFRLQNFIGYSDTEWIALRYINLLFGRNSSGKSAIIRAFLLLKQSLNIPQGYDSALVVAMEDGVDMGTFRNWVHQHDTTLNVCFGFKYAPQLLDPFLDPAVNNLATAYMVKLGFGVLPANPGTIILKYIAITYEWITEGSDIGQESEIFAAIFEHGVWQKSVNDDWLAQISRTEEKDDQTEDTWQLLEPHCDRSFFPELYLPNSLEKYTGSDKGEAINRLLKIFQEAIHRFLDGLIYLEPIREEPKRYYEVTKLARSKSNRYGGQYLIQSYLAAQKVQPERLKKVNDWLQTFGFNCRLEVTKVNEESTLYTISIVELREENPLIVNWRDVGFGLSQSLPVIFLAVFAEPGAFIIIEQPELHLHTSAQAALADLFIECTNSNQCAFLLETHSEHLLIRLRQRIAETVLDTVIQQANADHLPILHSNQGFDFSPNRLSVVFVTRQKSQSQLEIIPIQQDGSFDDPSELFLDFFGQDYEDTVKLMEAAGNLAQWEIKNGANGRL